MSIEFASFRASSDYALYDSAFPVKILDELKM
jgi:hypothetical protein